MVLEVSVKEIISMFIDTFYVEFNSDLNKHLTIIITQISIVYVAIIMTMFIDLPQLI